MLELIRDQPIAIIDTDTTTFAIVTYDNSDYMLLATLCMAVLVKNSFLRDMKDGTTKQSDKLIWVITIVRNQKSPTDAAFVTTSIRDSITNEELPGSPKLSYLYLDSPSND